LSFVVFLFVSYIASMFGPPPPGERALAFGGNVPWLFVLWAWWADRHRNPAVEKS